jgi:hypothetical protein
MPVPVSLITVVCGMTCSPLIVAELVNVSSSWQLSKNRNNTIAPARLNITFIYDVIMIKIIIRRVR